MLTFTRLYTLAALGSLLLYFLSGPLIFSAFWGGPAFPLPVLGVLTAIMPVLWVLRLIVARKGTLPLTPWGLAGGSLLTLTTAIALLGLGDVGDSGLPLFLRTVTSVWVLWLGGEVLMQASRRAWWTVVGLSVAALAVAIVAGVRIGAEQYGIVALRAFNSDLGTSFDYFSLTDPLALLGVLLLARFRTRPLISLAVFIVIGGLLFLGYSRTSLALYLVGAALVAFQTRAGLLLRGLIIAGVAAAAFILGNLNQANLDVLNTSIQRMGVIITNLDEDDSYLARQDLQREAVADVGRYWLMGRYGAEVNERGPGTYAHNWLSYLVSYGVVPFLASIALMLGGVWRAWRARDVGALALIVAGIGSVMLSRAYVWPYLWFALSLALHTRLVLAPAPASAVQDDVEWELSRA